MSNKTRITVVALCLFTYFIVISPPRTEAQIPNAKIPSPELVGNLTKELSITPEQAIGGSGALFGLAKTKLKADEFSKVSDAVPDMDGLLKAAPKPSNKNGLGAMTSALPGKAGGLASVAGSFKSLGLSPDMATKFVPIMTKFVDLKGGPDVGKLLSGALK
jgi:hypothetical protein